MNTNIPYQKTAAKASKEDFRKNLFVFTPKNGFAGLTKCIVGPTYSIVGLTQSIVGPAQSIVGLTQSIVGLTQSIVGPTQSIVGLTQSIVGLTRKNVISTFQFIFGPDFNSIFPNINN